MSAHTKYLQYVSNFYKVLLACQQMMIVDGYRVILHC